MKIIIQQNTVLKQKPVASNELNSADKISIYAGNQYEITDYKSAGYGHLEIKFRPPYPGQRETWYIFAPHIQLIDDKIGSINQPVNVNTPVDTNSPVSSPKPAATVSSSWKWPMRGTSMGPRTEFGYARGRLHAGVDIGGYTPDECYAASNGVVEYVKNNTSGADGRSVHIRRPDGWEHRYLHLRSIRVRVNDHVSQGQLIGIRGGSGFGYEGREIDGGGYSIHLHFEIRRPDGTPVDPRLFLPNDGSVPIVG
ncbi:M23 family peptidase [Limnospira fusiformis CCALA 023]|uniref:M23 family metallopeptidase n=1 Tax=Limnospira platensis TaxID=118562 RepID=UPI0012CA53E4|nr:M23 family metallopeptidase [Arthrospira sp. PLM2.Bin9]TVU53167.1 MAG: M23 family metallopeptidase [Arthrospira sp. PLM2.Bin9]